MIRLRMAETLEVLKANPDRLFDKYELAEILKMNVDDVRLALMELERQKLIESEIVYNFRGWITYHYRIRKVVLL